MREVEAALRARYSGADVAVESVAKSQADLDATVWKAQDTGRAAASTLRAAAVHALRQGVACQPDRDAATE